MSYQATASVVIKAGLEAVWNALTVPEQVKRYLFGTNLVTDWSVGSPVFFRGEYKGKTYEDRGTVLSFDPMRALSFNYWSSWSGAEDTPETRQIIRYALEETPEGIRVSIEQSNAPTQQSADDSAKNWSATLETMKKQIEEASS